VYDENDLPKDYEFFTGQKVTWDVTDNHSNPFTYNWFTEATQHVNNTAKHQSELEWELAQMDLIDYLVEQMEAYPDAEEMIQKVRKNLSI